MYELTQGALAQVGFHVRRGQETKRADSGVARPALGCQCTLGLKW